MRNVIGALLGLCLFGAGWYLFSPSSPEPSEPVAGSRSEAASSRPPAEAATASPSEAAARPIERTPFAESAPTREVAKLADARPASIRGRCVDAKTGTPLAGCKVALTGWPAHATKLEEFVARNGKVDWTDPPTASTSGDGRFEFRLLPPPPYQFAVEITADDRAAMTARFAQLEPGAVEDLGDVAMERGTKFRGRIVDPSGRGQAEMTLSLSLSGAAKAPASPRPFYSVRTGADGGFTREPLLSAGRYTVRIPEGATSIEPTAFELDGTEPERIFEFKVVLADESDFISGRIVDETGGPVPRAMITMTAAEGAGRVSMSGRIVQSRKDGSFKAERGERDRKVPVTLESSCEGYEPASTAEPVPWGAKDVSLVMRRGVFVDVVVHDGDLKIPLENYGVRCFPTPEASKPRGSHMMRLRETGAHPGGEARVQGITRGSHVLIVEPTGPEWLPGAFRSFDTTETAAPRQEVTMFRPLAKNIRVRRTNGSPVAGTAVDLLRRTTRETKADEHTQACTVDQLIFNWERSALLLSAGTTDSTGTVALRCPPKEPLVLRILGPGHTPLVQEVTFDSAADLDVVVASGATLTGRISPPELLAELHPRDASALPSEKGPHPGVSLTRKGDILDTFPPGRDAPPLGADGGFRLEGIPPGEWRVLLHRSERRTNEHGSSTSLYAIPIGEITLAEGDEKKRDFDLPQLLAATIEGRVTLDGAALTAGSISFLGKLSNEFGAESSYSQNIGLTPDGRFTAAVLPGEYETIIQSLTPRYRSWSAGRSFRVGPGQQSKQDFDLQSSSVKIRVVGSDGKTPLSGVTLDLEAATPGQRFSTSPTNDQGVVEIEDLQAGVFTVSIWPKRLASAEARASLAKEGRVPDDLRVRIGTIVVTPPETTATLVLTPDTGY